MAVVLIIRVGGTGGLWISASYLLGFREREMGKERWGIGVCMDRSMYG